MTSEPEPWDYVARWLEGAGVWPAAGARQALSFERCERLGVGGIVARVLQQRGVEESWVEQKVVGYFSASAERQNRLLQLADAFAKAGIEAIVLKGGALLNTVYAGQMSCRNFSDLDLLVAPGDLPVAQRAAAELGARPLIPIDWHLDLVQSARVASRAQLCRLEPGEVWKHSYLWRGGLRFLEPELQFVHLSLHAAKHSYCRLMWLVDLVLVRPTCDRVRLLELARRLGAERPVVLALHLAEAMRPLGEAYPRLRFHELVSFQLACRPESNLAWGEFFLMLSLPGWRRRFKYLREYLWLDGEMSVWRRYLRFLTNPDRGAGNA